MHWYSQWFWSKARMRGPTLNNICIPHAEGSLQFPMVQEGQCTDVLCCHSLEIISSLWSENDVLCSRKFDKEYCGESMLNFFKPEEEITEGQQKWITNQKLDKITKWHNSRNKAYSNDQELKWKCNFLSMRSICKHQKFITSQFHKLPIHSWLS